MGGSLDTGTGHDHKRSIEKVKEKGCFVAKFSIYLRPVKAQDNDAVEINLSAVFFIRKITHSGAQLSRSESSWVFS